MRVKCLVGLLASLVIGIASEWEETGPLRSATAVFDLCCDNSGNIYAATEIFGDHGVIFKSTNKGETWESAPPLPDITSSNAILCARDGVVYCGGKEGFTGPARVFKSTDGGKTWVRTGDLPQGKPFVSCLFETKSGDIYAGTQTGLFRSTNGGESWTLVPGFRGEWIRDMIEMSDGTLAVSTLQTPGKPAGVYISTDNGKTWQKKTKGLQENYTIGVWALFSSRNTIYAGTTVLMVAGGDTLCGPKVFKSVDKGNTWTPLNDLDPSYPPSPGEGVWSLIKTKRGKLYAGTIWGIAGPRSRKGRGKIYCSSDDMNWTFSDSFPGSNGVSSFIQTPDGTIYAGITGSQGGLGRVYKNLSETGIEEKRASPSFALQDYPNPFSKSITIRFQLPVKTAVSLKVYDITGKIVKVLKETQGLEPGVYTLSWDGRGEKGEEAPAGVYFIELMTQKDREMRKVVKRGIIRG